MPPTAQDVFNAWLLKVGLISGGMFLLAFLLIAIVAVMLVIHSETGRGGRTA